MYMCVYTVCANTYMCVIDKIISFQCHYQPESGPLQATFHQIPLGHASGECDSGASVVLCKGDDALFSPCANIGYTLRCPW